MVLKDAPGHGSDYASKDWDKQMAKTRTVISYAQAGLKARDLMLGVRAFGASRAFPFQAVQKGKLIEDYVGSEPILLVVGPDNQSVRVFRRRLPGTAETPQFYRVVGDSGPAAQPASSTSALLLDATTGSSWNFQGCAVMGPRTGTCLEHVDVIEDYWFDWRNYNPGTTVYGIRHRIQ
jgi:hypothetical protein